MRTLGRCKSAMQSPGPQLAGDCHAAPPWLMSPAVGTLGVPPSTPVAEALAMTSATCERHLIMLVLVWLTAIAGETKRRAFQILMYSMPACHAQTLCRLAPLLRIKHCTSSHAHLHSQHKPVPWLKCGMPHGSHSARCVLMCAQRLAAVLYKPGQRVLVHLVHLPGSNSACLATHMVHYMRKHATHICLRLSDA